MAWETPASSATSRVVAPSNPLRAAERILRSLSSLCSPGVRDEVHGRRCYRRHLMMSVAGASSWFACLIEHEFCVRLECCTLTGTACWRFPHFEGPQFHGHSMMVTSRSIFCATPSIARETALPWTRCDDRRRCPLYGQLGSTWGRIAYRRPRRCGARDPCNDRS